MSDRTDIGSPPDDAVTHEHHPRVAVAVLCAAGIVVALMQTIIVPLIPQLPDLLHADAPNASWALTITLLVGAVSTPIGGRLGDMYGKRLALLGSMAAVSIGSVVCALSTTLVPFLVGRGLQGLGFGTIALGISVMRDIVPARHLSSSVGTMSASLGVGGALGLPFSAAIAEHLSWHALFWVCAVAGIAGAVGIALTVPDSPTRTGGRFDVVGAVGLAAMLTFLLLPLSKGSAWGWSNPLTLGFFGGFVVVAACWCVAELRRRAPLIDLRVMVHRPVLLTNVASIATGFAFYSMQLIPIQVLMAPTTSPNGLGLGMLAASLVLAPSGLVMFVLSHLSGHITGRFGPRVSLALGGVVIGLGYVVFIVALSGPWEMGIGLMIAVGCLIGAGLGIAYSAMPALIMASVRVEQTGEANGVNALMRVVGTSTSAAVVGMILTSSVIPVVLPDGRPGEVPTDTAYLWAAGISLGACALAAITALAIPRSRRDFIEQPI
ncbi:MFS transporter [Gordonia sp. ABSL1-1]|uniref:MFS transporter n=1 Tax=Gordonia sp. ABSL1-1 TaxID=3053923 RepID=UPI0025728A55|nr:MFS transporter [Gordonia sp. ABSL1-1]MDL9937123.1 MFS transporter [Gordonia sp. ABSL1-1]